MSYKNNYNSLPETWAVDFDNTLAYTVYPDILGPRLDVITKIRKAKERGIKLILWTCREGKPLEEAINFCKEYGLEFDAINDNIAERKAYYNNNCRKIGADIYIDDRAILPENIK